MQDSIKSKNVERSKYKPAIRKRGELSNVKRQEMIGTAAPSSPCSFSVLRVTAERKGRDAL